MIQEVEEDRWQSKNLENSVEGDGRKEGQGQVQAGHNRSTVEQQRTDERIEMNQMTEGGRERTDL